MSKRYQLQKRQFVIYRDRQCGQAMTEYVSITAMLFLGLFVGGTATPYFSMMMDGLSSYLEGIMFVLNFPLL